MLSTLRPPPAVSNADRYGSYFVKSMFGPGLRCRRRSPMVYRGEDDRYDADVSYAPGPGVDRAYFDLSSILEWRAGALPSRGPVRPGPGLDGRSLEQTRKEAALSPYQRQLEARRRHGISSLHTLKNTALCAGGPDASEARSVSDGYLA